MSDDETDKQAIREVIAKWMKASAEGDLDTVLSLMAGDVVFLRAGCPPMRGREAFAAASKGMAGKMRIEGTPDIREIQIAGEYAFVWNYLAISVTPLPKGELKKSAGDILTVFRKEADGGWVLYRDANMLSA